MKTAVSPTRSENFPEWFQEVLCLADLAEHAPVRGCMIVKPNGYALWENIQSILDKKFKSLGVQNAYFPLFIPLSFLEKEAEHVEGFAKECAVVTHTRLEEGSDGKLVPASPLEEPLIVRPTSETIIGASFAKWIESYRDLPLKINQWCNVVRWEMRPRLFLRTSEFLWQEGHTAHASATEALAMAHEMLEVYADFAENMLAIPVIKGEKSEGERFPGAVNTFTFEAMMQDGKALQMGTSHYMGTNFAKSSKIQFLNEEGNLEYAHTTSWGVTTRMIGAVVMTHSDDNGLVLPPRIASKHIVIVPFTMKEETKAQVLSYCHQLAAELNEGMYFKEPIKAIVDERNLRAGEKSWDAIKKGYPIRIEIGARDIKANKLPVFLRTKEKKESKILSKEEVLTQITALLDEVHETIYHRALDYRKANTVSIGSLTDFEEIFSQNSLSNRFVLAPFGGNKALETKIQKDYGVTIRCIPHEQPSASSNCLFTKSEKAKQAIFAKSY